MMRSIRIAVCVLGILVGSVYAQAQTAPFVTISIPGPTSFVVTCPSGVVVEHGDGYLKLTWKGISPGPIPPNPVPPTPVPVAPPIPMPGLRMLIVYESDDLSKYTADQAQILYDIGLRQYLDSVSPVGPDGKTHEYRIWDKDVDATGDAPQWKAALARPHPTMPWIVISNGITGFEGPLPAKVADTLALLKTYEVKPSGLGSYK